MINTEQKAFLKMKFQMISINLLIEAESKLLEFLKSEKTVLDMAKRDAKSSESDETVFLPSLASFISERFGEKSDFYIAFKENIYWEFIR